MSEKRYLVLAEGHSDDPHHGKTARGVLRWVAVVGPGPGSAGELTLGRYEVVAITIPGP